MEIVFKIILNTIKQLSTTCRYDEDIAVFIMKMRTLISLSLILDNLYFSENVND